MNKGVIALIVVLSLCILCTLCSVGSYYLYTEAYKTPENLSVEFIVEDEDLNVGEDSEIIVKFKNTGNTDIKIASIETPYSVSEGIKINSTNPAYESTDIIELGDWKFVNYVFKDLVIPANSEKDVVFDITAKNSGYYSGGFTVYTDRMYNQIESFVSFYISE
jgi:hypothetical protein